MPASKSWCWHGQRGLWRGLRSGRRRVPLCRVYSLGELSSAQRGQDGGQVYADERTSAKSSEQSPAHRECPINVSNSYRHLLHHFHLHGHLLQAPGRSCSLPRREPPAAGQRRCLMGQRAQSSPTQRDGIHGVQQIRRMPRPAAGALGHFLTHTVMTLTC